MEIKAITSKKSSSSLPTLETKAQEGQSPSAQKEKLSLLAPAVTEKKEIIITSRDVEYFD